MNKGMEQKVSAAMTVDEARALVHIGQSEAAQNYRAYLMDLAADNRLDAENTPHDQQSRRLQLLDMARGLSEAVESMDRTIEIAGDYLRKVAEKNPDEDTEPPMGDQEGALK